MINHTSLWFMARIIPFLPKELQKEVHITIGEAINRMFT